MDLLYQGIRTYYTKVYGPIIPRYMDQLYQGIWTYYTQLGYSWTRLVFTVLQKRIIPRNIHPLYTPRYTQKFVGFFGIITYYSNLAFARARTQV